MARPVPALMPQTAVKTVNTVKSCQNPHLIPRGTERKDKPQCIEFNMYGMLIYTASYINH